MATYRGGDILDDTERLNGLVDAVAAMIGDMLSIRDDRISNGKAPLGQVLFEEREHLLTRERQDELEEIKAAYKFCCEAAQAASRLRSAAQADPGVSVAEYVDTEAFLQKKDFEWARGRDTVTVSVGRVGASLYEAVRKRAFEWLLDCDRAIMEAYSDYGDGEAPAKADMMPEPLLALMEKTADSIALRLTMLDQKLAAGAPETLHLDMEEEAQKELLRTAGQAESCKRTDLIALKTLRLVAQQGASALVTKDDVVRTLSHVAYVVQQPPLELGSNSSTASAMNLPLLERACAPGLDLSIRLRIVHEWHCCHGAHAAAAAELAIQKLEKWSSRERAPFAEVLAEGAASGHEMPTIVFAPQRRIWFFHPPGAKRDRRTGLDWLGRRIFRLTSLVWQLTSRGELQRGMVSALVVGPIATQAVVEARMVSDQLLRKRDARSRGVRLLLFSQDICDVESHIAAQVGRSLCSLSRFSYNEVMTVFHHDSAVLPLIAPAFNQRTRTWMMNCRSPTVHPQYTRFAVDALAIGLQAFHVRRQLAGVDPRHSTNPVADLLRTVPKAAAWSPLQGKLCLHKEDLRDAAAITEPVLREMERRGALVKWKRPCLKGGTKESRLAFVFDTRQLVALLRA